MERALITRMFLDDLKLAAQFTGVNLTGPARQHLRAALDKLDQLDALPQATSQQAAAIPAQAEVLEA